MKYLKLFEDMVPDSGGKEKAQKLKDLMNIYNVIEDMRVEGDIKGINDYLHSLLDETDINTVKTALVATKPMKDILGSREQLLDVYKSLGGRS